MSDTARATSEPETPPAVYDATALGKPRMFVLMNALEAGRSIPATAPLMLSTRSLFNRSPT